MRCDWQNNENAPRPCYVVNLETAEVISPCAMADEETGDYIRYEHPFRVDEKTGRVVTIKGNARIKIMPGYPPE